MPDDPGLLDSSSAALLPARDSGPGTLDPSSAALLPEPATNPGLLDSNSSALDTVLAPQTAAQAGSTQNQGDNSFSQFEVSPPDLAATKPSAPAATWTQLKASSAFQQATPEQRQLALANFGQQTRNYLQAQGYDAGTVNDTVDGFLKKESESLLPTTPDQGVVGTFVNATGQAALSSLGDLVTGAAGLSLEHPGMVAGPHNIADGVGPNDSAEAKMQFIENSQDPMLQWAKQVPETAQKLFPLSDADQKSVEGKIGSNVGGFLPVVASGPFAPFVMGAQSAGQQLNGQYEQSLKAGASPEEAAQKAFSAATASGLTDEAVWSVLPAPLRMAGDKFLIDKFGVGAVKQFILGRVSQAGEGATLGALQRIAQNTATGQKLFAGVGAAATGLGAIQLLTPRGESEGAETPQMTQARERATAQVNQAHQNFTDANQRANEMTQVLGPDSKAAAATRAKAQDDFQSEIAAAHQTYTEAASAVAQAPGAKPFENPLPTEAPTSVGTEYGREVGVHDAFANVEHQPNEKTTSETVAPAQEEPAAPSAGTPEPGEEQSSPVTEEAAPEVNTTPNGQHIAGPALVDEDGKVLAKGDVGQTHADLLDQATNNGTAGDFDKTLDAFSNDKQHAFVDNNGDVLDRNEARDVAVKAGQAEPSDEGLQATEVKRYQANGETAPVEKTEQSFQQPNEEKTAPATLPESAGARKTTPEGQARVEAAQKLARAAINNPDLIGKQRADTIANHRDLVNYLQSVATKPKLDTGYEGGDQVAYTGEDAPKGFRDFIYLEGHKAGAHGVGLLPEEKEAQVKQKQANYKEEQAGAKSVQKAMRDQEAAKKTKTVATQESANTTEPPAPKKSLAEVVNSTKTDLDKQLDLPKGATYVRVTDAKGRSTKLAIGDLKKENPLKDADIVKIEAGTVGKDKKFIPSKENVSLRSAVEGDEEDPEVTLAPEESDLAERAEKLRGAQPSRDLEEGPVKGTDKLRPETSPEGGEDDEAASSKGGERAGRSALSQPDTLAAHESTTTESIAQALRAKGAEVPADLADNIGRNYAHFNGALLDAAKGRHIPDDVREVMLNRLRDDLLENTEKTGSPFLQHSETAGKDIPYNAPKIAARIISDARRSGVRDEQGHTHSAGPLYRPLEDFISTGRGRANTPFHGDESTEGQSVEETATANTPTPDEAVAKESAFDRIRSVKTQLEAHFSRDPERFGVKGVSRAEVSRAAALALEDLGKARTGEPFGFIEHGKLTDEPKNVQKLLKSDDFRSAVEDEILHPMRAHLQRTYADNSDILASKADIARDGFDKVADRVAIEHAAKLVKDGTPLGTALHSLPEHIQDKARDLTQRYNLDGGGKSVMERIVKEAPRDAQGQMQSALARAYSDVVSDRVKFQVNPLLEETESASANYSPRRSLVQVSTQLHSEQAFRWAMLHEVGHSIDLSKIMAYREGKFDLLSEGDKSALDELSALHQFVLNHESTPQAVRDIASAKTLTEQQRLFDEAREKDPSIYQHYPKLNLDEFIEGVKTNPAFQKEMNSLDASSVPGATKGTVWGRIKQLLRRLVFGDKPVANGSVLARAFDRSLDLSSTGSLEDQFVYGQESALNRAKDSEALDQTDQKKQVAYLDNFAKAHDYKRATDMAVDDPALFNHAASLYRGEVDATPEQQPALRMAAEEPDVQDATAERAKALIARLDNKKVLDRPSAEIIRDTMNTGGSTAEDFQKAFTDAGMNPVTAKAAGTMVEAHFKIASLEEMAARQKAEAPQTTGIAQRVYDKQGVPVEPGKGTTPEAAIARGRTLLNKGADPEARMQELENTGSHAVTADDMSMFRAHAEKLWRDAFKADESGDKEGYKAAQDAALAWAKKVKPFQTEWSKIGAAQQGETEIDTGNFQGLRYDFVTRTGRDFTTTEKGEAEKVVKTTKKNEADIADATAAMEKAIKDLARDPKTTAKAEKLPISAADLSKHFEKYADNPTAKLTQPEIAAVWRYARDNYVTGEQPVHLTDLVNSVADDLNLRPRMVRDAFAAPKALRKISDDLYKAQSMRRAVLQSARAWIADANRDPLAKKIEFAYNLQRSLSVVGHVNATMTHAGMLTFDPTEWKSQYVHTILAFKLFRSAAAHEAAIQGVLEDPNYPRFVRLGLAAKVGAQDDIGQYLHLFKRLGVAGDRGMDILKVLRVNRASRKLLEMPPDLRGDDEVVREMVRLVNSETGTTTSGTLLGDGLQSTLARNLFFAPRLEASRWQNTLLDPIRAARVYTKGDTATPQEKYFASQVTRRSARVGATYLSSLAVNSALVALTGQNKPEDKINYLDPTRSDWLAFKWGGNTFVAPSSFLSPLRLLLGTVVAPFYKSANHMPVADRFASYVSGKVNPALGDVGELLAGKQAYTGRPLPWMPSTVARAGHPSKPALSWYEYALEKGPIPVATTVEAVSNSLQEQGVSPTLSKTIAAGSLGFAQSVFAVHAHPTAPLKPTVQGGY